ncbi:MAG: hypothetical protein RL307_1501 [Pseudomonadota bacterium]|jgi:uncharacterized membrane protein YedE/YeeE
MMNILESWTAPQVSAFLGVIVGLVFGVMAQRSRFCLRSATIHFWRGQFDDKLAVWLLTFGAALFLVQLQVSLGELHTGEIRQLNTVGSLSGAVLGGLMFGIGMILARGCASRLLILSATGNMRALVAGLVVTVVAQAALRGGLSPLREWLFQLWPIAADRRNMAQYLPPYSGLIAGGLIIVGGAWLAARSKTSFWLILGALGVGGSVALGWALTQWHASWSFDMVALKSVSFTGPSADTLMGLINEPQLPLSFDVGVVVGVFTGSLFASILSGEFALQSFNENTGLARYLIGAALMGFGGMLAGGCAVGAGITGGSILASTAWLALLFMWIGAGLTDALMDRRRA